MSLTEVKDYVPTIIDEYASFLIEVETCASCGAKMVSEPIGYSHPFPVWCDLQFKVQAKRAGLVIASNACMDKDSDKRVCMQCKDNDRCTCLCVMCEQQKPVDRIEKSYGFYPPEHLCKDCFETVSAKIWAEWESDLYEKHRWDCS